MPRKRTWTADSLPIKLLEPLGKVNGKHRFECPFCQSEFITTPAKVKSRHTKSCGCASMGKRTGSKYFSGNFLNRCKSGAKQRNIEWLLTLDELDFMMEEQLFKCNLTGRELIYGYTVNINDCTCSIDRIDSDKPYTIDNIQIVHKNVNMCKQSLSQTDFIELCKEVVNFNESNRKTR